MTIIYPNKSCKIINLIDFHSVVLSEWGSCKSDLQHRYKRMLSFNL